MTVPTCSSGTSHTPRSSGSCGGRRSSRVITSGPADLELVALPAHGLDEHGELQLAAAGHLEHVGRVGVLQADRHVAEHLAVEALPQVAAGEELARLAGQGRRVDAEGHRQHGLVDGEAGQRLGVGRVGERVADLDLGEPGDDEQVAGDQLVDLGPADAGEAPSAGWAGARSGPGPPRPPRRAARRARPSAACPGRPGRWRAGRGSRWRRGW